MKCIEHPENDLKYTLQLLHKRSSITLAAFCSRECLRQLIDNDSDWEHVVLVNERIFQKATI